MRPGHLSRKDLRALPRDTLIMIAMTVLVSIDGDAGKQAIFDEIAEAIRETKP